MPAVDSSHLAGDKFDIGWPFDAVCKSNPKRRRCEMFEGAAFEGAATARYSNSGAGLSDIPSESSASSVYMAAVLEARFRVMLVRSCQRIRMQMA